MAETIFQTLTAFFARYGYWVIFFGVMLENGGIPVPGETIVLFAGFLAYHGEVHLARAMITAAAGATVGDSLGYTLGRHAGTRFVDRYVRRFGFLSRQFDRAEKRFHTLGHWAVFIGRFITGLRVFAGPLAGMFRMPYLRFFLFNFSGAVLWSFAISSVGYLFGSNWERLVAFAGKFHRLSLAALGAAVLVVTLIYFFRRVRARP